MNYTVGVKAQGIQLITGLSLVQAQLALQAVDALLSRLGCTSPYSIYTAPTTQIVPQAQAAWGGEEWGE